MEEPPEETKKPRKPRKKPIPRFRSRATDAFKATLKPKALKQDWKKLIDACIAAIVRYEDDIIISFNYVFRYPKGFPKGFLIERTGVVNLRRIKASRLMDWLHENKHSRYNYRDIVLFRREFGKKQTELMNKVDIDLEDVYNFDINGEGG